MKYNCKKTCSMCESKRNALVDYITPMNYLNDAFVFNS